MLIFLQQLDNQHLFLQHHSAIFIPASGHKMNWLGHLSPQICTEFHSNINLCPVFYLKAYLWHNEPFRKRLHKSHVTSLFWGNNRQPRLVCAKAISSWVRKVLCIAKAHVTSLFWANNRQYRLVCAKAISSWVREFLCIAKAHFSSFSLGCCSICSLAACVSLVSILQAGDWARVSKLGRHYFSPISLLHTSSRVLCKIP